jgi:hypothetical protein
MGVTAIKAVQNNTDRTLTVQNRENPSKEGNYVRVDSGNKRSCDMWIPWCSYRWDFNSHHIDVFSEDPGSWKYVLEYAIWQNNKENPPNSGDAVRVSYSGWWDDRQEFIGGDHSVDGNRILVIDNWNQGIRLIR